MLNHAQSFDQFALVNAYRVEEDAFIKTVRRVYRKSVPVDSNTIFSHVLYKVKAQDDMSLMLKARIEPNRNEDSEQADRRSDYCMCPPLGIRVNLSTASIRTLRIVKLDVK